MLAESLVVSVVYSALQIASVLNATDCHCENHISTHWHHHPHSFPKNFISENQPNVSQWYSCNGLKWDLQPKGYSMWLTAQTFPVGNHWCRNLKRLWIRLRKQWTESKQATSEYRGISCKIWIKNLKCSIYFPKYDPTWRPTVLACQRDFAFVWFCLFLT